MQKQALSGLEDRIMKISQSEQQKENKIFFKKWEQFKGILPQSKVSIFILQGSWKQEKKR